MKKQFPEDRIDPKQDAVFKALFGKESNADMLMSLLNGLLELAEEKKITEIEYLSPIGEADFPDEKQFLMDLFVRDAQNKRYGIEMQVQNHKGFAERMLFYACQRYGEQLKKADAYTRLRPLVLVVIADFKLFPEIEGFKEKFQLIGEARGKVFSEHFSIVLVELEKFKKKAEEAANLGEKWLIFLKEGTAMQTEIKDPEWMTPALKKAIEELEKMEGDETQKAMYEARKREIQLQMTLIEEHFSQGIDVGLKKGREEGIDVGLKKGREEGAYQTAKKLAMRLLNKGTSLEEISELTELSVKDIQSIKNTQN